MQTTLPTTLQEFFDVAWNHAVVKKSPPSFVLMDEPEMLLMNRDTPNNYFAVKCRYRTEDGCRCLIGAAIPDDLYRPDFENITASVVMAELGATWEWEYFEKDKLNQLQRCHDWFQGFYLKTKNDKVNLDGYHEAIETNLRDFARKWELVIPGPESSSA
jgi:hypothetical protein